MQWPTTGSNVALVILLLIPLVGSLVVFTLREEQAKLAKQITLGTSLAALVYTVVLLFSFDTGSSHRLQFFGSWTWIKTFGVHLAFGVDGIALVLLFMAVVLVPAVVLASWNSLDSKAGSEEATQPAKRRSVRNYFALILLLEFFMVGVFTAADVFLFYVFFEAMLVPMYFIIGSFGGPRRQYAAMKFFLYSLIGGLLMLAAVIGVYVTSGTGSFAIGSLATHTVGGASGKWLFLGFFIAFAIKAPLVPFHTWLPDAGAEAPAGGAALLVGVLDKVGTFGFLRYCLPLFPSASRYFAVPIMVLSVIGILYAAFLAIGQRDMKRLVAYTSVAHFGFIGLGIFAFTTQAGTGAVLYMVNHGFSTGALFIVVGLLISRGKSRNVDDYGGAAKVTPILAGLFLLTGLSALALPGMSTFISEFLVLVGTFTRYKGFAIVATTGIVLAAIYVLYLYQRTFQGTVSAKVEKFRDLNVREIFSVAPLIALIVFLGVYPKPILDIINPSVTATLHDVGKTDPSPQQAPVAGAVKMSDLLLALPDHIKAPSIAYKALSPIFIVLGAALLGVIAEAIVPRKERFTAQLGITLAGLVAAVISVALLHGTNVTSPQPGAGAHLIFAGSLAVDSAGLFIQGTILALAIMAVLLMAERSIEVSPLVASAAVVVGSPDDRRLQRSDRVQTEAFPLLLFAVAGMLIFPIANNLILMFIALEVLSLPLYLLAGMSRRKRLLSQEAAVKYFLLGAFASAFFLYGVALLYGYADSVDLPNILQATRTSGRSDILLYAGLALLLVGLLFKAGIAPFHSWTPDVYQGAPTPITAFMAACTKVAAFGAILRVLFVGFGTTSSDWRPIIWAVAIASMVVGAIFGLTQTDIKRILAYSSIAHAGFILVGMVALTKDGISSVLFYVLTYGFTTLAAFGLLMVVRDADGEATHLSQWSGLARKSPVVAVVMTILLMSMAGIPLTSGFIGKFFVFRAAYHVAGPLVVIALVCSAIAAFFYLRIIVLMFFAEPPENGPTIAIPGWSTSIALTFGVVVTVFLGIFPQPILDLATKAAHLTG